MNIEQIAYGQWKNAYRCTAGKTALIVIADIGPRVVCLSYDSGPNLLFEDAQNRYTRGDWRLYGGHRFWVGPETELAFTPENRPCRVELDRDRITLTQPQDPMGLEKSLTLRGGGNDSVILEHRVRNAGTLLFPGCIWTLTVTRPAKAVIPWLTGSEGWQCSMVRYWQRWENHTTDPADKKWQPRRDYFLVEPDGREGKIGLYSEQGLLLWLGQEVTFVKQFTPMPGMPLPDGGTNVQIYTCGDFIELETLSPNYVFHPGQTVCHTERWTLLDGGRRPEQWKHIQAAVGSAPPAAERS